MTRQVRDDGWWSENDGMTWNHPAPDASASAICSGYKIVSIGSQVPVAIPNPIEKYITSIREEFSKIDDQHGASKITLSNQAREIQVLNARLEEYKKRYEEAEAKLEKIKGHL